MIRNAARCLLLLVLGTAACESTPPENYLLGGQTGSGSKPIDSCGQVSECEERSLEWLAHLREPAPVARLIEAECIALDPRAVEHYDWPGRGICRCRFPCNNDEGRRINGFECNHDPFADVYFGVNWRATTGAWCYPGDRMGNCLIDDGEAVACEPREPNTCDDECRLLAQRWRDERTTAHEVELRSFTCNKADECGIVHEQGSGRCEGIVRIDDQCWSNYVNPLNGPHDCALTDQEIFDAVSQDAARFAGPPAMIDPDDVEVCP